MLNTKIIEIPKNLEAILKKGNLEISFHSKYKNTVNFLVNKKIIAIQDKKLPLTPYSIKTSNFDSNISNEQVRALLKINSSSELKFIDLKINKQTLLGNNSLRSNLELFLKKNKNRSEILSAVFDPKPDNPFANIVQHPEKNIYKFVGLGNGLTPAGDDFIIGFLLGRYLTKKVTKTFKSKISRIVNQDGATNDISRQFLNAAIDGYFNEYVIELTNNIKDRSSISESLNKISRIGASSGLDLLSGLYLSII